MSAFQYGHKPLKKVRLNCMLLRGFLVCVTPTLTNSELTSLFHVFNPVLFFLRRPPTVAPSLLSWEKTRGAWVERKSKKRGECWEKKSPVVPPPIVARALVFSPSPSRFLFHCYLLIGAAVEEGEPCLIFSKRERANQNSRVSHDCFSRLVTNSLFR